MLNLSDKRELKKSPIIKVTQYPMSILHHRKTLHYGLIFLRLQSSLNAVGVLVFFLYPNPLKESFFIPSSVKELNTCK